MDALAVNALQKSFGTKEVLKGVSFSVPEQCVFGFIGCNGAGKTTTMKAVLGLLKPDGGEIFVCGEKVGYGNTKTNRFVGYLPDVPEFYGYMTAKEYLKLCADITGIPKAQQKERIEELLTLVGLQNEKHRIHGYSRGMKQRLGIAQALLHKPKLLICDEPTSALDPEGRKEILDILSAAKKETTVLFSTHILSDVERICDRVAMLHDGQIVLNGTMEELHERKGDGGFIYAAKTEEDRQRLWKLFPSMTPYESGGEPFALCMKDASEEAFREVLSAIVSERIAINKAERMEVSLEDLFLTFSKKEGTEE